MLDKPCVGFEAHPSKAEGDDSEGYETLDVARESVSVPVEWPWYSGWPRAGVSSVLLRILLFADMPMIRPIQSRPDETCEVVFTKNWSPTIIWIW